MSISLVHQYYGRLQCCMPTAYADANMIPSLHVTGTSIGSHQYSPNIDHGLWLSDERNGVTAVFFVPLFMASCMPNVDDRFSPAHC